jgi:hypothetical protein
MIGYGRAQSFENVWSKQYLATVPGLEFETLSDSTRWLSVTSDIRLSVLLGYGAGDDNLQEYVSLIGLGRAQSFKNVGSTHYLATVPGPEFETLRDSTR